MSSFEKHKTEKEKSEIAPVPAEEAVVELLLQEKGLEFRKIGTLKQIVNKEGDPVSDRFNKIYLENDILIGEFGAAKYVLDPETFDYAKILFLDKEGKEYLKEEMDQQRKDFDIGGLFFQPLEEKLNELAAYFKHEDGFIYSVRTQKRLTSEGYSKLGLGRGKLLAEKKDGTVEALGDHLRPTPPVFHDIKRIGDTEEFKVSIGAREMKVRFEKKEIPKIEPSSERKKEILAKLARLKELEAELEKESQKDPRRLKEARKIISELKEFLKIPWQGGGRKENQR